ncbi:LptF/LptG family permease [Reinekea marinisedimentorum]|uniref:LPS export ABC transporter permease LptF n=1 Tax=Reinekea marinisedimentorum TaxID=230495 RepID=A0A4R3I7A8_9GAMM|nr:LptF/LptG family permease [Reinekea marinisedimentorum]TCS41917.1 LPS export ABC transporter permease LptF [Reinekea marinisedimentorum]
MKINQYLYKEIALPFIFITGVLLALLISTELSETLTKVLTGQYSSNAILVIIGYQSVLLLPEVIPAAYFLACLTTLNRFSQDSERAIYNSIGISDAQILKGLLIATATPIFLIVILLQNIICPIANNELNSFVDQQRNRPITDIVQPKTFASIGKMNSTLFAGSAETNTGLLKDIFTVNKAGDKLTVIIGENASTQNTDNGQILIIENGQQTAFSFSPNSSTRQESFGSLSYLIEPSTSNSASQKAHSKTSIELAQENSRVNNIEIADRINSALLIPLFCLWAVALTRFKPRSAKAGAMATGIFFYILTNFSYRTIESGFSKTNWSIYLSPWWFFLALAFFGLLLIQRKTR